MQNEKPTTLSEAGINDNYCWDSSHPMGWDCYICRLQVTLPAFFEVVGNVACVEYFGTQAEPIVE